MCVLNEITHIVHIQYHGNYIEVKKINDKLEMYILRNSSQFPEGHFFFEDLGVQMTKTMFRTCTYSVGAVFSYCRLGGVSFVR